jgi:hypothetical protein
MRFLGCVSYVLRVTRVSAVISLRTCYYKVRDVRKLEFNATRDRGQKTEDCTVVNEGLVSR